MDTMPFERTCHICSLCSNLQNRNKESTNCRKFKSRTASGRSESDADKSASDDSGEGILYRMQKTLGIDLESAEISRFP